MPFLIDRMMDGRVAGDVIGAGVGANFEQGFDQGAVATGHGHMQQRVALEVLEVGVRARAQDAGNDGFVPVAGGPNDDCLAIRHFAIWIRAGGKQGVEQIKPPRRGSDAEDVAAFANLRAWVGIRIEQHHHAVGIVVFHRARQRELAGGIRRIAGHTALEQEGGGVVVAVGDGLMQHFVFGLDAGGLELAQSLGLARVAGDQREKSGRQPEFLKCA